MTLTQALETLQTNKVLFEEPSGSRYGTLRIFNDNDQYINERVLSVHRMQPKNYEKLMANMNQQLQNQETPCNLYVVEGKLFIITKHNRFNSHGTYFATIESISKPRISLYIDGCYHCTDPSYIFRALTVAVFSLDRYNFSRRKKISNTKIRKYYKSEIRASNKLTDAEKTRLVAEHQNNYVLFDMEGNHLGTFPRITDNITTLSPEMIDSLNKTLANIYSEGDFVIKESIINEEELVKGVNLC